MSESTSSSGEMVFAIIKDVTLWIIRVSTFVEEENGSLGIGLYLSISPKKNVINVRNVWPKKYS